MTEILQVIGATAILVFAIAGMAFAVAFALIRTKRSEDKTK